MPHICSCVRLAIVLCCFAVSATAQTSVFTTQPANSLGPVGGSADFSFAVQIPQAFANLGVLVFKSGVSASSRFSIVGQSLGNAITTSGNYTTGAYTVRISNITSADVGSYTFEVTVNGIRYSNTTSQAATLTLGALLPPQITAQPQSITVGSFSNGANLSVQASGSPTLTYQWYKNGQTIGETSATYAPFITSVNDAGVYYVVVSNTAGTVTSNSVILNVVSGGGPIITSQPTAVGVVSGQAANFSVAVQSSLFSTQYQWLFNGTLIRGANNPTFTIPSTGPADVGAYSVLLKNDFGSALSSAATLRFVTGFAPSIASQPGAVSVTAGQDINLNVIANGLPAPTLQWFKNDAPISGATASLLSLIAVQIGDAGRYSVRATNEFGTVFSSAALVTVAEKIVAPAITKQPVDQTGLVGESVSLSVLATSGAPASYQWTKNGVLLLNATGSTLTLSNIQSTDAGRYFVSISNSAGLVSSSTVTVTVNPASSLSNLSVRTTLAADQTLIVGGVLSGGSKNIVLRAGGPALNQFGLQGMADPRLELFTAGSTPVAANDDWSALIGAKFASLGAFPYAAGSKDAALSQNLTGAFTVQVKGPSGGVVLVEAFDATGGTSARMVNVSARNRVGSGDDILIAGFFIAGTGTKRLLIRGVGPGLAQFGVTGVLTDPKIVLFNNINAVVATNDNWDALLAATFNSLGAFGLPSNSKDAAFIVTLAAGNSYTVQLSGADGGTGDALIEIYEVP